MAAMPFAERWIGDPNVSHCRDCHQVWKRQTAACHCVRCHVTFNSPSTSARHDLAEGAACKGPEDMDLEPRTNKWGSVVWWSKKNE